MMASALPNFDPFDIHADGAIAKRWRKWITRLENQFVAPAITDKKRQRALLLYYAGEEVCEIFETLVDTGDDFAMVKEKLTEYFDPKKNVEYEIYTFWQARQNPGESMNAFYSRLRQLSATCEFGDVDKEIKSQIILTCSSQRLRRKALRDTTMTLETLLNEARALKISETQAKDIESSGNAANALLPTPSQPKKNCFSCGGIWPLDSRRVFPREIASATAVINMVTMRNAARKSHVRPEIPEKESSPVDVVIPRKRKNKMLTDWKPNVRNVRPRQTLMTSIHSG